MKKIISVLLAILMLCSCAPQAETPEMPKTENPEQNDASAVTDDEWGITFSVKNVTPTGATVVFTQRGGNPTGELSTGSYYRIEHENKEMAFIADENAIWTEIAYMIPNGGEFEMETDWQWLYGELEPGTYRIVKEVMDFRDTGDYDIKEYSVEFTIGEEGSKGTVGRYLLVETLDNGKFLLADEYGIVTLNPKDIPVYLDGEEADFSDLADGSLLHIRHSGDILASDPGAFEKVYDINAFSIGTKNQLGGTLFDLCGLYIKVLDDLWEADSGLNGGAEYVSIDLSAAPGGLSDIEKDAIRYAFGIKHGVTVLDFTFDELKENGYLTAAGGSNDLYQWDNGVFLSITNDREETEMPNAFFGLCTIEFDAMKWRGPLGAYFFEGCTVSWPQMGTWTDYSIEAEMIS